MSPRPAWLTAAAEQVRAEQADQFVTMLTANHRIGAVETLDVLTRGLSERPDLVPGVTLRLLDLTGEMTDDD